MSKANPNDQELLNRIESLENELVILKRSIDETDYKRYLTMNDVLITADSEVVVINEDVTITATFSGLAGKIVSFYNGSNLLGATVTNTQGVATLTTSFDAPQVANIRAICEDILSELYQIKVGTFVYSKNSETTLTTDKLNSADLRITGDFALEFDIKQTNSSGQLKISFDGRDYGVTTHIGISHSNGTLISYREGVSDGHHYLGNFSTPYNMWHHVKMTRRGSVFTWFVDDTLIGIKTLSTLGAETMNTLKGLRPNNGVGIVKNLVIYPI